MSKNKSVENTELNEVLKEMMNEILESDFYFGYTGSLNPHFKL
jgi:hypothetical protein